MKPKVMGRLKVHNSVEELYEHIPKEYLPKDYGGEEPCMEESRGKNTININANTHYVLYILVCI